MIRRRITLTPREPKRMETYTTRPRTPAPALGLVSALPLGQATTRVAPKTPDRRDQRIRDSARGEECLIVLPGCPRDAAMTIWSHNRHGGAGKGMAMKSLCILGCYGCTYCDSIYDGQRPRPTGWTAADVELAWYRAHDKSLVILKQKGLV